jgi:nitrous oxidase accessory protein NosD
MRPSAKEQSMMRARNRTILTPTAVRPGVLLAAALALVGMLALSATPAVAFREPWKRPLDPFKRLTSEWLSFRALDLTADWPLLFGPWLTDQVMDGPELLFVDDDGKECPDAQFTSIQAAVQAAPPGAKIRVCPGEYQESVIIDKALTVQARRLPVSIHACETPLIPDPTKEAILRYGQAGAPSSVGFRVQADGVTISGFVVEPNPAVTENAYGILTSPAFSGHRIAHNVLQRNTIGAYFNSSGAATSILSHNCIRDNNLLGGISGVYSDSGLRKALIQHNYFTGHENAAIALFGVSEVAILNNDVIHDSTIILTASSELAVLLNRVVQPAGTGIFVNGGVTATEISFNYLSGGAGSANGVSIRSDLGTVTTPNENNRIRANRIMQFPGTGIRLGDKATKNTIEANRIESNGIDGIEATPTAVNNLLLRNRLKSNVEHDCHDDSAGAYNPPGLVGNAWVDNVAQTQNRPALCKRATTLP